MRPAIEEWRYTEFGRVKHRVYDSEEPHCAADCGHTPHWAHPGWLGTGNQEEYEKAATLPECKRCQRSRG